MKIGNFEYLTPKEFAKAKGCSEKTVYNWMNAGEDSNGYIICVEKLLNKISPLKKLFIFIPYFCT